MYGKALTRRQEEFFWYVILKCFAFVHKPVYNFTDTLCDL